MQHHRFRVGAVGLAVGVALAALAAAALATPSAVAALKGAPAAVAAGNATPVPAVHRSQGGGRDGDERGGGRDGGERGEHGDRDDHVCLYPPSNRPKLNLYDPNEESRRQARIAFRGTARIHDCGVANLSIGLYQSSSGGGGWSPVPGVTTLTRADGVFILPQITVTTTTFFKVISLAGGGLVSAESNIVKIKIKR